MDRMTAGRLLAALLLLASLVGVSGGAVAAPPGPDIVGGTEADEGEYPFMVGVAPNGSLNPFCGGSLVRPDWVLTAAHCLTNTIGEPNVTPGELDLLVGWWDLGDPASGERIDAIAIEIHPSYGGVEWDAALIQLASDASAPVVDLATPADAGLYPPGADATVIGWGLTQGVPPGTPPFPDKLREITIPVVSDAACDAAWGGSGGIVDAAEICAGGETDRDSCSGDSGGPLMALDGAEWLQIGIVSSGSSPCGELGFPGIYAQVDAVESWIVSVAGPGGPTGTCDGQTATIVGTSGDDTITGTNGPDVIDAKGGNDIVDGMGGNDLICGGDGDDTLNGGDGKDILLGGSGDDSIDGDGDDDTVSFKGSAAPVTVNLGTRSATGEGSDTLRSILHVIGSPHDDFLRGNAFDNTLDGGAGNDVLIGMGGADDLRGGAGDDQLNGRAGDDVMDGGPGTDQITYIHSASGVTVNLGAGVASGGHGDDRISNVENIRGSNHNDVLKGDDLANVIAGGGGDDEMIGKDGDDDMRGNKGTDTAAGQAGTDFCRAETTTTCEL